MKAIIEITEQMQVDKARCNEDSDCDGCSCVIGTNDCIFNHTSQTIGILKSEMANFIADFITTSKETVLKAIKNKDADIIRDEAFEYLENCDTE